MRRHDVSVRAFGRTPDDERKDVGGVRMQPGHRGAQSCFARICLCLMGANKGSILPVGGSQTKSGVLLEELGHEAWKNMVTKPTMSGVAWRGAGQFRPPGSLI